MSRLVKILLSILIAVGLGAIGVLLDLSDFGKFVLGVTSFMLILIVWWKE